MAISNYISKALPRVSVIMSVYNGERFLSEAVDSILNQTFGDFELIIINDGSTDGTPDILQRYRDPRMVVVEQENRGLPAALNSGISMARGQFIARMDADDVSLPGRLERQLEVFEKESQIDILCMPATAINERLEKTGVQYPDKFPGSVQLESVTSVNGASRLTGDLFLGLLDGNFVAHPSIMVRSSVFCGMDHVFDEEQKRSQDYHLWLRLARAGCRFGFLDMPLYLYRQHGDNSGKEHAIRHGKFKIRGLSDILTTETDQRYQRAIKNALAREHFRQAYHLFGNCQYRKARKHFGCALSNRLSFSAMTCWLLTCAGRLGYVAARRVFSPWRQQVRAG
jgi:glycosyltransferase involved in cell wall biosynthesis